MATVTSCTTGGGASNPGCVSVMSNYCSTDDIAGPTYQEKWEGDEVTSNCRKYVSLNTGNQPQYVPVVDAYVRRYLLTDANPITYAQQGSLIYDPAIEDVIEVCQDYPGGCDNVLGQDCSGFTRNDLKNNPNMGKLCGCFMSDAEYDKYTGAFGVSQICDPACVLQSAVKPRDPANQFGTLQCQQSICVIDDVTISILQKSQTGDITFAQACSSCSGGAGCTCNISDISIQSVQSTIKDINFDQQCGGVQRCYKRDANGIPQLVDCSALTGTGSADSPASLFSNTAVLLGIIILVALVLIVIIVAIIANRRRDQPTSFRVQPYAAPPPPLYGASPPAYVATPLSQAPLI